MTTSDFPLDGDELMDFAGKIAQLPPTEAEWVERLFQECLRARISEGALLAGQPAVNEPEMPSTNIDMELAQAVLDASEWLKTLWNVGYMGAGSFPAAPRSDFPQIELEDVLQSSLFARIRQGKRPLPFPPPTRNGLPWHDLVEGPGVPHDVAAEIVDNEEGLAIGAIIEGCADWRVIEKVAGDDEYIVQHRGKGPLYRLCIDQPLSVLFREQPRWMRRIRSQERAGVRSFMLEWPRPDGSLRDVPLRAATWERAEAEAGHWIAANSPEMYGQVSFERVEAD
ncbi:hypothetical protein [Propionivibrio limicola]|uniref:hypothetical protein n=1 Tax=Propionivibrio limicola TaxID=167645 RepID=UPI0012909355|nr:hypothetical protein [Propionivibrio limicola]